MHGTAGAVVVAAPVTACPERPAVRSVPGLLAVYRRVDRIVQLPDEQSKRRRIDNIVQFVGGRHDSVQFLERWCPPAEQVLEGIVVTLSADDDELIEMMPAVCMYAPP